MPSAVPFQTGLIGQYNNASSPGVYVSWDANTSFNSVYSLIFSGMNNLSFKFPLIASTYTNSGSSVNLGTQTLLAKGTNYIFAVDYVSATKNLVALITQGDTFSTVTIKPLTTQSNPTQMKCTTIGAIDYLLVGYTTSFDVYSVVGSTITALSSISFNNCVSSPLGSYTGYDFDVFQSILYFSINNLVNAVSLTVNAGNLIATYSGPIATTGSNSLANNPKKIAIYENDKLAIIDTANIVYEFINPGGQGTNAFTFGFSLAPNASQTYSAIIYNHAGLIIATDTYNDAIYLIAGSNVTISTKNYGTFDGYSYQVISTSSTTSYTGSFLNKVGSQGVAYLQFNNPSCIVEDQRYNLIIGDYNDRLTYFPTQLNYLGMVEAPLTEYIDANGGPETIYYIKQSTANYFTVFSIPPISGDELLIKSSVLYELNSLLRVPVYDEELLFGFSRQSATLAHGDIVTDPAPQVRISVSTNQGQRSSMYVLSPYTPIYSTLDQSNSDPFDIATTNNNYPNGLFYRFTNEGKLYFYDNYGNPVSVQEYDVILVTYYVKLFTNAQINNALYMALQAINAQPGLNKIYSVASTPFWYDQTLVSGATYYLLRQLLVGLNSRERRLLVQDPEQGGFDAINSLKDTAKMYQEEFNELLKKLPIAKRPTMGSISVPEYAMPGGRSRLYRALWTSGAS
jgi:hypothetical protein